MSAVIIEPLKMPNTNDGISLTPLVASGGVCIKTHCSTEKQIAKKVPELINRIGRSKNNVARTTIHKKFEPKNKNGGTVFSAGVVQCR